MGKNSNFSVNCGNGNEIVQKILILISLSQKKLILIFLLKFLLLVSVVSSGGSFSWSEGLPLCLPCGICVPLHRLLNIIEGSMKCCLVLNKEPVWSSETSVIWGQCSLFLCSPSSEVCFHGQQRVGANAGIANSESIAVEAAQTCRHMSSDGNVSAHYHCHCPFWIGKVVLLQRLGQPSLFALCTRYCNSKSPLLLWQL